MNKKEIKTLSKPWITPAIQKSIVIKNFYFRKSSKSNNPTYYCKFKRYRNKLNHLIKISKKRYYNNFFIVNTKNIKNIWKGIRSIINLKANRLNLPTRTREHARNICVNLY